MPMLPTIQPTKPAYPDKPCRIVVVGEVPTQNDMNKGYLFSGYSGKELTAMMHEAKLARGDCYITSVFKFVPPKGDLNELCSNKKNADRLWQEAGNAGKYPHKALSPGKYLMPQYLGCIDELFAEIAAIQPNVIITLGNTPLWVLTGESGITKSRGTVMEICINERNYKVLPTFNPAYVLRRFDDRPLMVSDLQKAEEESHTTDFDRFPRELWTEPNLADIRRFINEHLREAPVISCDIETARGQITCIGFGTKTHAICIPFVDERKSGYSYWPTAAHEVIAINTVSEIFALGKPILGQNFMFDLYWMWKVWGVYPSGEIHDTMLMHHSLQPEMQKSLGFMASVYTNEIAWKKLAPRSTKKAKES